MQNVIGKIVITDSVDSKVSTVDFTNDFFDGIIYYHIKEIEMFQSLIWGLMELRYSLISYRSKIEDILLNETPEFHSYIEEIRTTKIENDQQILLVFRKTELNYHFKTFLILTKSVLDKVVPLFDYRYKSSLHKFSSNGKPLINYLKQNIKNKPDFEKFININIEEWITDLIKLRDKYTHFSELEEYKDFQLLVNTSNRGNISSLKDFVAPTIEIKGESKDALEYMQDVYHNLSAFINGFLKSCNYESYQKPPIIGKCVCGFKFGKLSVDKTSLQLDKAFAIKIENKELKLGTLICPECTKSYSTDLAFWEKYNIISL